MKIGYYYHICVVKKNNQIYLPSFLSVFFDELAKNVEKLVLFLHEATTEDQIFSADGRICSDNIIWVNMGKKKPAWYRSLFANQIIKRYNKYFDMLDALIIRSPSPLAPYFKSSNSLKDKLVYMLVSDYKKGAEMIQVNHLRNLLVKNYVLHNDKKFKKCLRDSLLIVNSSEIYNDHKHLSKSIFELRTTTLRNKDFYKRKNQNLGNPVKLLFTGRIVLQKGLINIIDCLNYSENEKLNLELHIVGWEDSENKPFEKYLKNYAEKLNLKSKIIFHGLKSVGDELNAMYRMADIYVLPSHHEGFPRTIWEAMANSLPVISTTVGSIPKYVKNYEEAILVPPKDSKSLFKAIKSIISNNSLRLKLVKNSLNLVSNHTLEIQTKKIIEIISDEIESAKKTV